MLSQRNTYKNLIKPSLWYRSPPAGHKIFLLFSLCPPSGFLGCTPTGLLALRHKTSARPLSEVENLTASIC
jgi:hypothetical protein